MHMLAKGVALLGGLVLCGVITLICISIAGRILAGLAFAGTLGMAGDWLIAKGVGPIAGDFELVEAGIAFAVFAFLPLTQLRDGHATVDLFTGAFGPRIDRNIAAFWRIVMAAIIVLITWRLFYGMLDRRHFGETGFLIRFPLWWAYAASFGAAVVASVVSLYSAWRHLTGHTAG